MELKPLVFANADRRRPTMIAGPCGAESEQQILATAQRLSAAGVGVFRAGVWKPRTKPGTFAGAGDAALPWLREVKRRTGMLLAVEVATPRHVAKALEAGVDILWIGARTSTNPFAVQEIADSLQGVDTTVLIKNPVNPDLELWIGAIERIYNAGCRRLGAIHRGFSEYGRSLCRNVPHWRIPIELHRRLPSLPLYCDPSHMGGRRELIEPLSQQAMTLGFDGLFVESHCSPDDALSDREQQITPEELRDMVNRLTVGSTTADTSDLSGFRREIDDIDDRLLSLLSRRMQIAREIGDFKKRNGLSVLQAQRYDQMLNRRSEQAPALGLDAEFVRTVLRVVHEESVNIQMRIVAE